MIITRKCSNCKIDKEILHFHRCGNDYQYTCKLCKKELSKKYKQIHKLREPVYNRQAALKRRYNLTIKDYNNLYIKQKGLCAICFSPDPKNGMENLCVDHCHKTGKIRGLLCGPCNRALGCFYDNPQFLKTAISYLEAK